MKNLADILNEKKYDNSNYRDFDRDINDLITALAEDKLIVDVDNKKYKLSIEAENRTEKTRFKRNENIHLKLTKYSE